MTDTKGCLTVFNKLLDCYLRPNRKYTLLSNDQEKKETSKYLGGQSITWSISTVVVIVLALLGARACVGNFENILSGGSSNVPLPLGSLIGGIVLLVGAVIMFIEGFLTSFFYMIFQFKLNKLGVRYTALVLLLVGIVGSIVAGYVLLFV